MRMNTAAKPFARAALCLALTAALGTAAHAGGKNSDDTLKFDSSTGGTAGSVTVFGQTVTYTAYTMTYVAKPNDPAQQVMTIYIPSNATQASPIFMPLNTGGYMQLDLLTPADVTTADETGANRAAAMALAKGIVVASAAGRGRDSTLVIDGVTTEVGDGPSAIVDLKAAVRYLRHNDKAMLGNAEKIIISGTSGGGAYSSLVGTTGDSPLYKSYLNELGAAQESDAVFAVAPYCPITDLDNANSAYEYYFNGTGITVAHGRTGAITLSANDQALSTVMANQYVPYLNGLDLKHPRTGAPLKLNSYSPDAVRGGSYRNYVYSVLGDSATRFILQNGYVNGDGSLNSAGQTYMSTAATMNGLASGLAPKDFISWNASTRTATLTSWKNLMLFMNRMKPVGAFDNGFASVTGEMDAFNTDPTVLSNDVTVAKGWNHFDENLGDAIAKAGLKGATGYTSLKGFVVKDAVAKWAAMMNPMYYIVKSPRNTGLDVNPYAAQAYGSSEVARHWRIRVGSYDRDSSPFVSLNLATVLQNRGAGVNYQIAWNQPHAGNYDNSELIAWMVKVAKNDSRGDSRHD